MVDLILLLAVAPVFHAHFLFPISIDFELSHYVFSILIYFAFCCFINGDKGNLNNLFNLTALIFYIAPITALSGLNASLPIIPVLATFFAYTIINLIVKVRSFDLVIRHRPVLSSSAFFGLLYLCLLFFIGWAFSRGAFRYLSLDLGLSLYSSRERLGTLLDVGIMTYFNIWVTKVFAITLFGVALFYKKRIIAIIMVLFFIFAFAVTSHRTILFLPILVLMVYYFYASNYSFARLIRLMSMASLLLLTVIILFDMEFLSAIVFRRALFVAPAATYLWFDYFSVNDFVFWTDRFLSGLVSNQYNNVNLPFFVGDQITEGQYDSVGLNAGLIATGFANYGWIGVVIYSFIFGSTLRFAIFLNKSGIPTWFLAIMLINPIRTIWTSTDIFTGLLTHGIIIAFLMLFFAPVNFLKSKTLN